MAKPFNKKAKGAASNENLITGRVTAGHGRHHFVTTEEGNVYEAHRRGKKGDVVVGDFVHCTEPQGNVVAIEKIDERRNMLYRSDEWRIKELASNLDLVTVVFASRPSFNPWFIWKAIIAARTEGIDVLIIRNKCDLTEKAEEAAAFAAELESLGETVVNLSAQDAPETALETLSPLFAGKTVLLVGQSGMGKSTLLNVLCPEARARTREFSEALDLGKQTTTHTALYATNLSGQPGAIVDSPGFQEFGLSHVTSGDIVRAMPDIAKYEGGCRFYNCTHVNEPACSVKDAVEKGLIRTARYDFYKQILTQAQKDLM